MPGQQRTQRPARPTAPSAYLLELSIPPGVVRRGDVYAHGAFDEVLATLRATFINAPSVLRAHEAFLALCHDESILLWKIENGDIVACSDVRRFLSVFIGDEPRRSLLDAEAYRASHKRLGFGLIRSAGAGFLLDEDGLRNAAGSPGGTPLSSVGTLTLRDADALYRRPTCLGAGDVLSAGKNDLEREALLRSDMFMAGLMRLGASRRRRVHSVRRASPPTA